MDPFPRHELHRFKLNDMLSGADRVVSVLDGIFSICERKVHLVSLWTREMA